MNTPNLDLEKPARGAQNWDDSLNLNMDKLDSGYGNNVASIADLPDVYVETGTFNGSTGDTISLPKSVDAVNEYNVSVTPTSRAAAIGDIYVTKTTSNFVVKCSEANTSDTFAATIYYIGDVASYGGSIYRRWYVSPDAAITDHSDNTDNGSLAWVVNQIGSSPATVELPGNKTYFLTANSLTVPDNIRLIPQKGAVINVASAKTLIINGDIICGISQHFAGSGDIVFGDLIKEVYPQWFGALGDGVQDDQSYIQKAIDAMSSGTLRLVAGTYKLNTMQSYTSANTGTENGILVLDNAISIRGDGRDKTILDVTLDDTFYGTIVLNGIKGATVEDIAITGTGSVYNTNYGGGIRVLLSTRISIRNCHFEDLRGIGINFVGNNSLAAGDTDYDYYCTYNVVEGNILRNVNGDGIYHIFSKYNHTHNNILYKTGYTDAIIYEASLHSTVSNNIVIEPSQRAILLNTGSSWCTVTGNTTYHYDASTVYDSILIVDCEACIISDNVVEYASSGGAPQRGIAMYYTGALSDTYHNIIGNIIVNGGTSTAIGALHIQSNYNKIEGNIISSGTHGIMLDEADYCMICNNYIDNSGYAIRCAGIDGRDDPTYAHIANNYCDGSQAGIFVDSGCDNIWINNNYTSVAAEINTSATNIYAVNNIPDSETLTTSSSVSNYKSTTLLDSTAGAALHGMYAGLYVGQKKTIIMTVDGGDVTIRLFNHITSSPEDATFDDVGEYGTFVWNGSVWITESATCTF